VRREAAPIAHEMDTRVVCLSAADNSDRSKTG
jgi:hypothetical protein